MTKILRYNSDKKVVEEFEKDKVPVSGDQIFLGSNGWSVGLRSVGCGCHSSQVDDFRKDIQNAGIRGVEVLSDGSVKFSCRSARNNYLKFRGMYDRDAGYGDLAPDSH